MNHDVQLAWETALRSGRYAQGRNALCRLDKPRPRCCCLGVLCELAADQGLVERVDVGGQRGYRAIGTGKDYMLHMNYLPDVVQEWAGLEHNPRTTDGLDNVTSDDYVATFADANDTGKTFTEIADLVAAL